MKVTQDRKLAGLLFESIIIRRNMLKDGFSSTFIYRDIRSYLASIKSIRLRNNPQCSAK